jgi:hypothetical protein
MSKKGGFFSKILSSFVAADTTAHDEVENSNHHHSQKRGEKSIDVQHHDYYCDDETKHVDGASALLGNSLPGKRRKIIDDDGKKAPSNTTTTSIANQQRILESAVMEWKASLQQSYEFDYLEHWPPKNGEDRINLPKNHLSSEAMYAHFFLTLFRKAFDLKPPKKTNILLGDANPLYLFAALFDEELSANPKMTLPIDSATILGGIAKIVEDWFHFKTGTQ